MAARRKGIGYIRVSRVAGRKAKNGGESYLSPELQRERILAIAKANGIRIVEWYTDEDKTGKTFDRPGFKASEEAIAAGRAQVIVVARMSRFARNVLGVEEALVRIEAHGGQLVAGDLNVDTTTPQGKLMRTILAAIAQFELEVLTEQWAEAKAKAVDNGVKISNRPPIGYRWNFYDEEERAADPNLPERIDPTRPARSLVVDPLRGPAVVELFELRAAGGSASDLVRRYEELTGERQPRQTLMYALKNRAYLGEIRFGKDADALVEVDAHEALVTPEQFDAVQTAPAAPRGPRNGAGSLLAGILHCAGCGKPMTATRAAGKKPRYVCQNLRADCPAQASVLQELADPVVEEKFLAWAKAQKAVEGAGDEQAQLDAAIAAEEAAAAEVTAYAEATSAAANPELFKAGLAKRESALEAAQEHTANVRASGRVETLRQSAVDFYLDPASTVADKRKLLAGAIERVDVHAASGRRVPFAERSEVFFRD